MAKFSRFLIFFLFVLGCLWSYPRMATRFDGPVLSWDQTDAERSCPSSVRDYEGNVYPVVAIGSQCWMRSNLASTQYSNGDKIIEFSVIDNDRFGLLYSFDAVASPKGLCPRNWHVSSDEDFSQLERLLGMPESEMLKTGWRGENNLSRRLKQYDTDFFWDERGRREVNQTGLSVLPAGAARYGQTMGQGRFADFWTSTEVDDDKAWYRSLFWISETSLFRGDVKKIRRKPVAKDWRFSVRCVQN